MMKMMRETPIAFGLTMVLCLALFFYCWYARKLRHRLVSVQVSATPDEVQEKTGIDKAVVDSFPTIKTLELKVNIKDELQCPICLGEYGEEETLRKLPHCGHVFHIPCVDSWLANQITCPVCRVELNGTKMLPKRERRVQQSAYYRAPATSTSVTVELATATPTWILMNRPRTLPPACYSESHNYDIELQSSNHKLEIELQSLDTKLDSELHSSDMRLGFPSELHSSGTRLGFPRELQSFDTRLGLPNELHSSDTRSGFPSESLLAETAGWGASTTAEFSFQSQAAENAITGISHSSISERWVTESFSFGNVSGDGGENARNVAEIFRRSTTHGHLPLTLSPEHCVFEFLPIVTSRGGDCSLNASR